MTKKIIKFSSSLKFGGTGTSDLVNVVSDNFLWQPGTVWMGWIKFLSTNQLFLSRWGEVDSGDSFRVVFDTDFLLKIFNETSTGMASVVSNNKAKLNEWNFVGIAITGSSLSIYLNGVLATSAYAGLIKQSKGMKLGGAYTGNFGNIKATKIHHYNSLVATQAMFDQAMNDGIYPATPTAKFEFNEGIGLTLGDTSGNNINGVITSDLWDCDVPSRRRAHKYNNQGLSDDLLFKRAGDDETIYCYNDVYYRRVIANPKLLQKSTDNGVTFTDLYTFANDIEHLMVLENGTMIVATNATNYWGDTPSEIYRSTDNGVIFTKVFTLAIGGVASWSFDFKGTTIFIAEYGKYNSTHLYRSIDSGATWTTSFTHPVNGSTQVHLHKVHIDNFIDNLVFLSSGDDALSRGVWYSRDNGATWNKIPNFDHQPTWIESSKNYVFFMEDLEGAIHRISKQDLLAGDFNNIEKVYDSLLDKRGDFGPVSFYCGRLDSFGNVYAGGVTYGKQSANDNKKSAPCLVTKNEGKTWELLKLNLPEEVFSSGISYITKENSRKQIVMRDNNYKIYRTWTNLVNNSLKDTKRDTPVWSGLGINYRTSIFGHIDQDIAYFKSIGINKVRINIEWPAITREWFDVAKKFKDAGFYVVAGFCAEVSATYPWSQYVSECMAAAPYAVGKCDELQIGNEADINNKDTDITDAQIRANTRALATQIKTVFPGIISYSTSVGFISEGTFGHEYWMQEGKGDIDRIGINAYGWISNGDINPDGYLLAVPAFIKEFGSAAYVSELNMSGDYGTISTAKLTTGMEKMLASIVPLGIDAYLFQWRGFNDQDDFMAFKLRNGSFYPTWDTARNFTKKTGYFLRFKAKATAERIGFFDKQTFITNSNSFSVGFRGILRQKVTGEDNHTIFNSNFNWITSTGYLFQVSLDNKLVFLAGQNEYVSTYTLPINTPVSIIYTLTGTTLKVYVNGTLIWTQTVIRVNSNLTDEYKFGSEYDSETLNSGRNLRADVYELFITSRELTQAEVTNIQNGVYPTLNLRYNFMSNNPGYVANDLTGNQNFGRIFGCKWNHEND